MKNKEVEVDDYDDSVFATEKAFDKRFRSVSKDEVSTLKRRIAKASEKKSRVTIYFDSDIVRRFKALGEAEGVGYQTLMNQALRRFVDDTSDDRAKRELKDELLKDKKFLKRLKAALST